MREEARARGEGMDSTRGEYHLFSVTMIGVAIIFLQFLRSRRHELTGHVHHRAMWPAHRWNRNFKGKSARRRSTDVNLTFPSHIQLEAGGQRRASFLSNVSTGLCIHTVDTVEDENWNTVRGIFTDSRSSIIPRCGQRPSAENAHIVHRYILDTLEFSNEKPSVYGCKTRPKFRSDL